MSPLSKDSKWSSSDANCSDRSPLNPAPRLGHNVIRRVEIYSEQCLFIKQRKKGAPHARIHIP